MTAISEPTVLQQGQLEEAGHVLGRAFFDDPLTEYLLPDESTRARPLTWFMRNGAKYSHLYGQVHTTPETVDGAACWLPPGDSEMTPLRMLRTGLPLLPFRLGLGGFRRFMTVMGHLEELHKRDMPEPHWYLMILGVDTAKQGQGIGGAIIQPILTRADADGLPCYLETMKERNLAFYQKHGFEVVVEGDAPKGGPHYWTMKRPSRRSRY